MQKKLMLALMIGTLMTPLAAQARPEAGRLTGSIGAELSPYVDGDVHGGAKGGVASLAALNPGLPAVPADLNIESRSFKDIYEQGTGFGVELAYGLSDNIEVFAAVSSLQADGSKVNVGGAFVPALSATLPVFGEFGDLKGVSLSGGARYYFEGDRFRPFVGGNIGVTKLDAVKATFTIPSAPAGGITLQDVPFFDETNVVTFGGEVGLDVAFTDAVYGAASVGLKYTGEFDGDDSAIGGLGLASINDGTDNLSVPVTLKLGVRF